MAGQMQQPPQPVPPMMPAKGLGQQLAQRARRPQTVQLPPAPALPVQQALEPPRAPPPVARPALCWEP